jgi:hypothetical protein
MIDDFSNPDPASVYFINAVDPDPLFLQHSGVGILGSERDLLIDVLGAANPISANGFVGTTSPNVGVFNLGTATSGPGSQVIMQYDGADSDTAALNNALGLSADLTTGGNNGIRLDFNFLQIGSSPTMDFTIDVTSAGASASYTANLPLDTGAFSVFVPFASFSPVVGVVDFAAVTSLQFSFNELGAQDVDFELDQIVTTRQRSYDFGNYPVQTATSSLAGFVYVDCNKNGVKDPGEVGIAGVTITLVGTTSTGQPVNLVTQTNASGAYSFADLLAGTYQIIETQPAGYIDGIDTIGTPGGTTGNDTFTNIVLPAQFAGVNNNFGEYSKSCKPCHPCPPPPCPPAPCPPPVCHPPVHCGPPGGWDPPGPCKPPKNCDPPHGPSKPSCPPAPPAPPVCGPPPGNGGNGPKPGCGNGGWGNGSGPSGPGTGPNSPSIKGPSGPGPSGGPNAPVIKGPTGPGPSGPSGKATSGPTGPSGPGGKKC